MYISSNGLADALACRAVIYLLLAAAAVAPGTSPEERVYSDCVMAQAKRLTPSGEPAETIARVSKLLCQDKFDAALARLHKAREAALEESGVSGTLDETRRMLNDLADSFAITVVVEERAKAHTR
jgi:hypothetical protein